MELCQEKGIAVRIVKLPESPNIVYSEQYNSEWENYYSDLKEEFSNIASAEWIQSYKADLFSDPYHLNIHGAMQLSRQIREMYPEDFGEKGEWSEKTKEAIWDYIMLDDNPKSILEWIDGKNLTAIILQPADYDLQDDIFDEKWEGEALYRKWADDSFVIYYVAEDGEEITYGIEDGKERYRIIDNTIGEVILSKEENEICLHMPWEGEQSQEFLDGLPNVMNVIIIDRTKRRVICRKTFR